MRSVPVGFELVDSGDRAPVLAPFDGHLIDEVPVLGAEAVDAAVQVGRECMERPLPAHERAAILDRAAALILERTEVIAKDLALEAAKPIRTARTEVERCASTLTFSAVEARTMVGEQIPMDASVAGVGKLAFTLRVPIGVVGAITPFNFPLNLVAHKVGPAIAAGCAAVVKPASQTPLSSLHLADALRDAGLPPGWLSVVPGSGTKVGGALVDHPDVPLITFTGSPEVGWAIRGRAARKRVGLELGNNAPAIIAADGNWQLAADKIAIAGYSHAGQSCISTQRVYVARSLHDFFVARLVERVDQLVVGDPLDERTDVSSLISTAERERVTTWVDEARGAGATLRAGGSLTEAGVLRPTVLTEVAETMKVCANEVFGPVVAVLPFDQVTDALQAANTTAYGLQAAIFTSDWNTAWNAVRTLDFGGVIVNDVPTFRADQMPYGGLRDSGNTREGPHDSVREMTERRLVVLQMPDL